MHLVVRHLFREDYTSDHGWSLLDWCLVQGAAEFTVSGLVSGGHAAPLKPFDEAALPFKLSSEKRRDLDAELRVRDLWELNDATIRALRLAFPLGLFDYDPRPSAWFEDLTVYRAGEVMLGIVTHEGEGVIRLTPAETDHFHAAGYVTRAVGEWVGFESAAV